MERLVEVVSGARSNGWRRASLDARFSALDDPIMTVASPQQSVASRVFGTGRQLPQSYVARREQQVEFEAALEGDGHIVLWGEPRQGKSSLVRHQLRDESYCVIGCTYGQRRYDVYRMLLREAGASVAVERKRRRARGIGAKVSILSGELKTDSETTERAFDIDIANVNDVLRVVQDNGFEKIVVLEDFHYLGRGAQRELIQDLKLIYEKSNLRVILVGVWGDRSRLRGLHGDLAGRLDAIEVPRWSDDELLEVLRKGRELLGVEFAPGAAERLVACSQQSVGLLQDVAYSACLEARIGTDATTSGLPLSPDDVDRAVQRVLERSIGRLRWYVSSFANPRNRGSGRAQPYKGVLHALLLASKEELRDGIASPELLSRIQQLYPYESEDLTQDRLLKGLNKLSSVHRAARASPVLGYDSVGDRLYVVDPLVRLFLTSTDDESLIRYLPDQGRDVETDRWEFERQVRSVFGNECAVCSTKDSRLIRVTRLGDPPAGQSQAPEYGLPLCLNHGHAWDLGLLAIEPATTKVRADRAVVTSDLRPDLSHLPGKPARAALESAWGRVAWRFQDDDPDDEFDD